MSKIKVLIGIQMGEWSRTGQCSDLDQLLNKMPPEVEINLLPVGEQLRDYLPGIEVLFGKIGEEDFNQADALRWIHQPFAGAELHMFPSLKTSEVVLTNCRGLYGTQISEHAFALLFALSRNIPTQLEFMRRKHWEVIPCVELVGKTMGILGLGGIGKAIAIRAKAFDFNVIGLDSEPIEKPYGVDELGGLDWLPEFMSKSDVVVVCCPSTLETHKMLSYNQFELMPQGSYLVNISRGKVIDEEALVVALRSGKLAGAGLDVTYTEPCPKDSPLWTEPNVILTSHSAGESQHNTGRVIQLFIDNLYRYVNGKCLVNVVDKSKGF